MDEIYQDTTIWMSFIRLCESRIFKRAWRKNDYQEGHAYDGVLIFRNNFSLRVVMYNLFTGWYEWIPEPDDIRPHPKMILDMSM